MLRVIQGSKAQDQSTKKSNVLDINNRLRQRKLKVVETKNVSAKSTK
jgi:hypothetical protein